jgi:hypothetical protein
MRFDWSIAARKYRSGRDSGEMPRMDMRRGEEAPEDRLRGCSGSGSGSGCGVVRFELSETSFDLLELSTSEPDASTTSSSSALTSSVGHHISSKFS